MNCASIVSLDFRAMLLINLIFEFVLCSHIVQAGYTPRAWLPSDLATFQLLNHLGC